MMYWSMYEKFPKTKKINEVFKDVLEEADRLIQEAIKFHQKTI